MIRNKLNNAQAAQKTNIAEKQTCYSMYVFIQIWCDKLTVSEHDAMQCCYWLSQHNPNIAIATYFWGIQNYKPKMVQYLKPHLQASRYCFCNIKLQRTSRESRYLIRISVDSLGHMPDIKQGKFWISHFSILIFIDKSGYNLVHLRIQFGLAANTDKKTADSMQNSTTG